MATIPERLASLETVVETVHQDVSEIKTDVKRLLLAEARHSAFSSISRYIVPVLALMVSFIALFRGG